MTEQEWLQCTDPKPMLDFLRGKASDRKLRLFAVGYCRRIWHVLKDERSQRSVEISECYADGESTMESMFEAGYSALAAIRDASPEHPLAEWWETTVCTPSTAYNAARNCAFSDAWKAADSASGTSYIPAHIDTPLGLCLAVLLRDIFGNPFRPITINPAWLAWNDGTVRHLAHGIYDEKAFDRMPILADALEEARCDNKDILDHCRSDSPHVKGCWVVDLVLGKE